MQQLPLDPNFIQKLSLPIELFGFTLLIIELFFPHFVEYLESRIDTLQYASEKTISSLRKWGILGTLFVKLRKPDPDLIGKSPKIHLIVVIYNLITSVLIIIAFFIWLAVSVNVLLSLFILITMVILYKYFRWPVDLFGNFCSLLSLIPLFILTFGLGNIFNFMNIIGRGKAFGAIGIILSTFGLLGECYQVYCIEIGLKDDSNYFKFLFIHATLMLLLILWARMIVSKKPNS